MCSWCIYSVDRCGALATGFPSSISDDDILTPFGRPLDDISSVSLQPLILNCTREAYKTIITAKCYVGG